MADKNNKPSTLFAISILAMAASLAYFTFEFSQFVRQVPDILENVRITSEKIEPVLDEVAQIRDLIPAILVEVSATREAIPPILGEVKNIRESIPPILTEVSKTREQIPAILDEVAAVREQLPATLATADKASDAVVSVSTEMKAYQPIATDALVQMEGVRKEVPVILDRVDAMIGQARVAARDASSGMITGFLGGVITAPFRLVGNFGSSVMGLSKSEVDDYTDEDIALVEEHGKDLITSGILDESRKWKNFDRDQNFEVSLVKIYVQNNRECRDLRIQAWKQTNQVLDTEVKICLNEKGEWDYE
ncbi:hypothetical protein MNBD_GAMMA25-1945 [hydrothermal vent metagenome]|uniref:Uncharacterized protein n=1 Tax=hydrothermal vent metagenome TaxID=652676 RepID=A0A3B1BPJ5_9ZZZZ